MNNQPRQLERIRKEHYDKLYERYPQLRLRLNPLINKSDIIEDFLEPELEGRKLKNKGKSRSIKKGLNRVERKKITNSRISKKPNRKKISQIKPKVLYGLN